MTTYVTSLQVEAQTGGNRLLDRHYFIRIFSRDYKPARSYYKCCHGYFRYSARRIMFGIVCCCENHYIYSRRKLKNSDK